MSHNDATNTSLSLGGESSVESRAGPVVKEAAKERVAEEEADVGDEEERDPAHQPRSITVIKK